MNGPQGDRIMASKKDIHVYMDWYEFNEPVYMGLLQSERLRGKEVFSYENDPGWLKYPQFRSLDPDLTAFTGKQFLPLDKKNFGLFLDSSPDRWGRTLLQRREAIIARSEGRSAKTLTESDFLMGVYDGNRMGGLRFKFAKEGEFMDNNSDMATPPWSSLRELEYASQQIESEDTRDRDAIRWLNMLIAPGSSLGGARPKANIIDSDNKLWIAKFPSNNDDIDVGAWEYLCWKLANLCGVKMSESRMQKFSSRNNTFLTKRFDRTSSGKRIHFASAMTMLGYSDGDSHVDGVSYLEMVEWIIANCANTNENLEQLWRRIVFNIAVSNCDDHLRNHGFILNNRGWELSPAYDINPDRYGSGLKLNISEHDNSLDFDLALSVAPYFHLSNESASQILVEIKNAVSQWRKLAAGCGISNREQELLSAVFRF